MVYCVNFRMRQTKGGRQVNFPLLLLLQLRLLGYPMSTMSSYLSVTALLACCLCMTLHLMYQVQQWLHQMLSLFLENLFNFHLSEIHFSFLFNYHDTKMLNI